MLVDSPDVLVADSTTATQAIGRELSVFVHPDNAKIVLMSLVNTNPSNPDGCAGWVSQNGGQHWHGDNLPAFSEGFHDPAAVIRRDSSGVRYHILSITSAESDTGYAPDNSYLITGQRITYKDSRVSTTWPSQVIVEDNMNKTQHTDKGHLWVDNDPNGGNLYAAYSTTNNRLYSERSITNGATWTNKAPIDTLGSSEWGVNLKVAIDSQHLHDVYAVYPTGANGLSGTPTSIQFKKSTNEGGSWSSSPTPVASYGAKAFALRDPLPGGNGMGVNSAPVMVVDEQGNIYVVWCQKRRTHDGTGNDAQVYIVKSTDAGADWTALGANPKTVNQDGGTRDQWLPWAAWDNGMKALVIAYFDSRNDPDSAEVYLGVSYDRGATFREVKVSDVPWSGDLPSGGAPGAAGDYNGIDAGDGVAYPMWADNRESASVMKAYVSPIQLWGIVQDSISASHSTDVGLVLNVTIDWVSDLKSDGLDQAIITAPSGAVYTATATPAGPTTGHAVSRTCVCEPGWWTYEVRSSRIGYSSVQKADATKTFKILWCLD